MGRFTSEPFQPPPPKPPTNGLGIAGFVLSLVGFLACPLLSPVALVLSFIAVFREPRGLAIAGLVLGALGSIGMLVVAIIFAAVLAVAGAALSAHGLAGLDATFEMIEIGDKARVHRQVNGVYPASIEAMAGSIDPELRTDWWGRPYEYTPAPDGASFSLRSLGNDGKPDTPDDIVLDQTWLSEP